MNKNPSLLWLRRDLRLQDNPALQAAVSSGRPLIVLFILDENDPLAFGEAQYWWLHHSLALLGREIEKRGARLTLRRGASASIVREIVETYNCDEVYWNRRYAGEHVEIDMALKKDLAEIGVEVSSFNGSLLKEPWEVKTQTGGYYRVYSPYWRSLQKFGDLGAKTSRAPKLFEGIKQAPESDVLDDWALLPSNPDWASDFSNHWTPGEKGARKALSAFLDDPIDGYKEDRDRPDKTGTSRLSPHLAFGEISPDAIWYATSKAMHEGSVPDTHGHKFLSELAWRDFAYHLLFHNPSMTTEPFRPQFKSFPWRENEEMFLAWKKGQTGIPIIDAGMRELWQTGWMHNRVRMIVASFLTKNLLIDWRHGERWFWDCLLDADIANNPVSWQWVAGSGADAAPYFRIFNAATQGQRFDPDGAYVRKYVPELGKLDKKFVHNPWDAGTDQLSNAGVNLGDTYPKPIVDLKETRKRALEAFDQMKNAG